MTIGASSISIDRAERIVREVARDHVVPTEAITSRSRKRHVVDARSEAAWRLWSETELRLWQIGAVLGGIDHSSVIYLVRRFDLPRGQR